MEETLLPIYRKFTKSEIIKLLKQEIKQLSIENEHLKTENFNLSTKNKKLTEKIKEDEKLYPSNVGNGKQEFVKAKTHNKLVKRYQELDKRFWELHHSIKSEKL